MPTDPLKSDRIEQLILAGVDSVDVRGIAGPAKRAQVVDGIIAQADRLGLMPGVPTGGVLEAARSAIGPVLKIALEVLVHAIRGKRSKLQALEQQIAELTAQLRSVRKDLQASDAANRTAAMTIENLRDELTAANSELSERRASAAAASKVDDSDTGHTAASHAGKVPAQGALLEQAASGKGATADAPSAGKGHKGDAAAPKGRKGSKS